MTLMATEKPNLPECALAPLAGRYDGRDCGHFSGLIRLLSDTHLAATSQAHARAVIGCQCCECREQEKRAMARTRNR